jgi:PKD repeat protein
LYISPANSTLAPQNSLVTFTVSISNVPSDTGLGAWDIVVAVGTHDLSVLQPVSIALVENFSGTVDELSNCVGGHGQGCSGADGSFTAHSAATSLSGPYPSGNITLFSVTYKATGASGYTFISLEQDQGASLVSEPDGTPINVIVSGAVYGNAALAPVAVFSWSPLIPYAGDSVTFNASLSYDPSGGRITAYYWPSKTTTIPVATLIFPTQGNYTVTLQVRDDQGRISGTVSHIIKVNKKPITDLDLSGIALSQYFGISPGTQVKITPTVTNNGTVTVKFFNVTLKLGDQVLGILQNTANLTEQQRHQFSYTWDTTGLKPNSYTISAVVSTLPKDNDTQDKAVFVDVTIIQPMGASPIPVGMIQLLGIIAVTIAVLGVGSYSLSQRRIRKRQREMEAL